MRAEMENRDLLSSLISERSVQWHPPCFKG